MIWNPLLPACGWMLLSLGVAVAVPVRVVVLPEGGLQRGGEAYFIKGAGGDGSLNLLKARGGNSVRTWSHEKLGATLAAGIWLEPECSWFSYANPEQCAKQAERVRKIVLEHKDQPALLMWGLGNEMEGDGRNAPFWQQLNRLAKLVHEIDPAHPVFTALAGMSDAKANGLNQHAPDLDLVGINTYGALPALRDDLAKMGWTRPWAVTEFGTRGFWEVDKTSWGAPLEPTSTEKAVFLRMAYEKTLKPGAMAGCLGGYAFLWGQKQEASATWFGLLTKDGGATPAVEVLEEFWTDKKPVNRAPVVETLKCQVAGQSVSPGRIFEATLLAKDPDGDALMFEWKVLAAHGGRDKEGREFTPTSFPASVQKTDASGATVTIAAPAEQGEYRVYGYVRDGKGNVGTANAVILVR